jgi:hypothetical protein
MLRIPDSASSALKFLLCSKGVGGGIRPSETAIWREIGL